MDLTGKISELSYAIIWAAESCTPIPQETFEQYNELAELRNITAIDYFNVKAEMSVEEEDDINSLEKSGEYSEAVMRASLWVRHHESH